MEYIRSFSELNKDDTALAGGKGAALGELTQAGFPVPPGFVLLTPVFMLALKNGGLDDKLMELIAKVEGDKKIDTLNRVAAKIAALIHDVVVPVEVRRELSEAFAGLGAELAAVRSSAAVEDGAVAAWAGQLESRLNVCRADLLSAVKDCWASLFSPRALAYRLENKVDFDIAMAVVVQEMVDPAAAGVAFSLHPVSGREDQIVVEAVAGLAEALVAGRATPSTYLLDKESGRCLQGQDSLLTTDQLAELTAVVVRIEKHFGFPVDVEWTATADGLRIVQSRPITAWVRDTTDEQDSREYTWSNLNIAEVLPGVIAPLVRDALLNLIQPGVQLMLRLPRDIPLIRAFKGRLYFNLTAFEGALSRLVRIGDIDVTQLLGGEQKKKVLLKKVPAWVKLKLLFLGGLMLAGSLAMQGRFRRLLTTIRRRVAGFEKEIDQIDDIASLVALTERIMTACRRGATTAFAVTAYPFFFYIIYNAVGSRWLKNPSVVRELLAGGGRDLPEIEALVDLWELRDELMKRPRLKERFLSAGSPEEAVAVLEFAPVLAEKWSAFLTEHGHRCAAELNFSLPRWREDPAFIVDMLKIYCGAADGHNPLAKRPRLVDDQQVLLAKVGAELGKARFFIFRRLLNMALKGQRKREQVKSEVVKLLLPLRLSLLKIGRSLEADGVLLGSSQIFMLTLDELRDLENSETRANLKNLVANRAGQHALWELETLPAVIDDSAKKVPRSPAATPADSAGTLSGIAVSHGRVNGIARVVLSLTEISRLRPGDILITDHTDPGWTPVFATIKGLVTNTGGLISHAAIVAREYGLPAVVNVPGATERIKDGQAITLDADLGRVTLRSK